MIKREDRPPLEDHPPRQNVAKVKDPKWTGAEGEMAVIVSRGEPRRSVEQMEDLVGGQVERYLLGFTEDFDGNLELVYGTVELISEDYIRPVGSQRVMLTREHLLAFVNKAQELLEKHR